MCSSKYNEVLNKVANPMQDNILINILEFMSGMKRYFD